MKELAERVDGLIYQNGLSRRGFCAEIGINDGTVRSWGRGAVPSVEHVYKIAQYFGVSVEWLVTGKESEEKEDYSQEEKELVDVFRQLDERDKNAVISLSKSLASQYSDSTGKNSSIG